MSLTTYSTESWLPVAGFEGLYEVSDAGRVRSVGRIIKKRNGVTLPLPGRILKPTIRVDGYLQISLVRQCAYTYRLIHALVAEAFIGPRPKGWLVAHFNGIKSDNHRHNLRYTTRQGNAEDSVRLGEMRRGEESPAAKISEATVRAIRAATGTQSSIARKHGVSQTLVSQIRTRKIWRHVV